MTRSDTPALPAPVPGDAALGAKSPAGRETLLAAQAQARRGLKGGAGVLSDARTAYCEAQWSGRSDRRPEPGLLVRAKL